jgi:hypothetical protein
METEEPNYDEDRLENSFIERNNDNVGEEVGEEEDMNLIEE